jgi:hypothetical protein
MPAVTKAFTVVLAMLNFHGAISSGRFAVNPNIRFFEPTEKGKLSSAAPTAAQTTGKCGEQIRFC